VSGKTGLTSKIFIALKHTVTTPATQISVSELSFIFSVVL